MAPSAPSPPPFDPSAALDSALLVGPAARARAALAAVGCPLVGPLQAVDFVLAEGAATLWRLFPHGAVRAEGWLREASGAFWDEAGALLPRPRDGFLGARLVERVRPTPGALARRGGARPPFWVRVDDPDGRPAVFIGEGSAVRLAEGRERAEAVAAFAARMRFLAAAAPLAWPPGAG